MSTPVHEKPEPSFTYERLDLLWERYPRYHERTVFSTMAELLEEHASWKDDYEEIREEYEEKQYDDFLVRLSWEDLYYRHETRKLIEAHEPFAENPYVTAFLDQFRDADTDHYAYFLFPESYVSQFFVILEVCRRAKEFHPVKNLFPDEEKIHYLAVFDKENMDDVLLMYHLLYANASQDLFGGYSLYDYSLPWYQTHLRQDGIVMRSPWLPDATAVFQGCIPYYYNPVKTVYVRRNIDHILACGYFRDEADIFVNFTKYLLPFFQWWYTDLSLYEEKDGYRTDWRLERTRIRSDLTAQEIIRPRWKHELSLFSAIRKRYPDTLYQYRPEWLGMQSLDMYIPSLNTGVEFQGIQHYRPVEFFGGEEALSARQELDETKRKLCAENSVRLVEWPYDLEPTDRNVKKVLETGDTAILKPGESGMERQKEDIRAQFMALESFDEYLEKYPLFTRLEKDSAVFEKEQALLGSDESRTRREKEALTAKRKRQLLKEYHERIRLLMDEIETEGVYREVKGRTRIPYTYRYPGGKQGDIADFLISQYYSPKQTGENQYTAKIRRKDGRLIEFLVLSEKNLFQEEPKDNPEALAFLAEYSRVAEIERIMYDINCLKEEYRNLRSVEDPSLRKLLQDYHKELAAKRDEIYEKLIGDGRTNARWKSEQTAYAIVQKYFPDAKFQYKPDFLGGQRLDIYIPSVKTAVEYMGRQHYEAIDFFGGEQGWKDNTLRDERKQKLCRANGVKILYWDYDKPLEEEYFVQYLLPLTGTDENSR